MTNKLFMFRLAAAASALTIIPLAGCGGSTINGDNVGPVTQAADPYIYGFGDNITSTEVSGFGSGSATNPAAGDIFYFTFASANSAPTLTESGAGPFVTGIAQGSVAVAPTATSPTTYTGSFAQGSYVPGVPAGSTSLFFRAQGAQGQTTSRVVPDITAATLSVDGGAAQSFTFPVYNQATAAGPFVSSPYYLPTSFAGITASGVYSSTATITDSAKNTTSTTFQSVVLAGTDGAIASSEPVVLNGGAVAESTYGPDASGTTILILPAGPYDVTVNTPVTDSAGVTTVVPYESTVTVTAGQVYIAQTTAPSPATGSAAIRRSHAVAMRRHK